MWEIKIKYKICFSSDRPSLDLYIKLFRIPLHYWPLIQQPQLLPKLISSDLASCGTVDLMVFFFVTIDHKKHKSYRSTATDPLRPFILELNDFTSYPPCLMILTLLSSEPTCLLLTLRFISIIYISILLITLKRKELLSDQVCLLFFRFISTYPSCLVTIKLISADSPAYWPEN